LLELEIFGTNGQELLIFSAFMTFSYFQVL